MILRKFLIIINYVYQRLIPLFLRERFYKTELKISYFFNPLLKGKITALAKDDCFKACIKELNKKKNKQNKTYLHKVFNRHLIRSNLIDDKWWSEFITIIDLPNGFKFEQYNRSLIEGIDHYNFDSLEHYEILMIYYLSIRFSLFELAYHLREKAKKISLGYSDFKKKKEIWKLKAKLSALLEIGNYSKFDQLLKLFGKDFKKEVFLYKYLKNLFTYDNIITRNNNLIKKNNFNYDQNFLRFIENKEVNIVSPSKVISKDGEKIDSADIVIRTRYSGNYSKEETKIKGSKCDVSYIYSDSNNFFKKKFLQWPLDISWIVCKVPRQAELIFKRLSSEKIDIKNLKSRIITRVDKVLFNGSLHGLPNIVLDILPYNPKKIFLFHFDMMLTKTRIKGYHIPESWLKDDDDKDFLFRRLEGFAGHDPITQFVIMKSLYKKGLIDGDDYFDKVISMSVEDYMKNLQKNYSRFSDIKNK